MKRADAYPSPPLLIAGVSAETPAIERGGAERMRSGGVVGMVQGNVSCNRLPVPTRCPQPLSQTLRVCQLPLHRGAKPRGGRGLLLRGSQAQRGTGDSPLQEPSPAGTGMLHILLKTSFFRNFAPDSACPGRFCSYKMERGLLRSIICAAIPFDLSLLLKKIRRAR